MAAAQKMAMVQKIREQQKEQYFKKKGKMYGEKVGPGLIPNLADSSKQGLDFMELDRREDAQRDHYDPFYKVNKLDIELQAQMNIMNKQNTLGNKMWTPEY